MIMQCINMTFQVIFSSTLLEQAKYFIIKGDRALGIKTNNENT